MKLKGDIASLRHAQERVTEDVTLLCSDFEKFVMKTKCMSLCISQVGVHKQIVAVKSKSRKSCTVMVNPVITHSSKYMQKKRRESCMSGNGSLCAEVSRPMIIMVEYNTPSLHKVKHKLFFGRRAAAACLVIDLCEGKLIR